MHCYQPIPAVCAALLLAACGTQPITPSPTHIQAPPERAGTIPQPVRQIVMPPPPKPAPKTERYSVVVNNVRVQDLLYALARDARVNVDIHSGIEGAVTLNVIDQTLPQILTRIAKQVDMRFEMDGPNLVVMADTPFLRSYNIDYVNVARNGSGAVGISTQVASAGNVSADGSGGGGGAAGGGSNSSTSQVNSTSNNRFWETLTQNVKDLLHETDKILPDSSADLKASAAGRPPAPGGAAGVAAGTAVDASGSPFEISPPRRITFREAASVIANPEAGVISVRATSRQHEKIQEFLDSVLGSARRQVLIEATIVEVLLSDNYQSGVDWSRIIASGNGFNWTQTLLGNNLGVPPVFTLNYNPNGRNDGISATVKLLDSFGSTRVLSSPKIMALNNQTALLRVVDNVVYFSVVAQQTVTQTGQVNQAITTTPHTVSVGVVMSVTPQISESGGVSLSVRPTISRILRFKNDPNPTLGRLNNPVPEIQVREMESLLRMDSGQIVVLGGLMQDSLQKSRDGIPLISKVPVAGDAFSFRNDTGSKTELVIFLRPLVIRDASIEGDLKSYRSHLPDQSFLKDETSLTELLRPKAAPENRK
jgi:MSHA biogenesis protein MshL